VFDRFDGVRGGCRSDEGMTGFHIIYNVVTNVRWAGQVARMGRSEVRSDLVQVPDGKGALGRYKRTWKDNIKVDFQEIVWGRVSDSCGSADGQVSNSDKGYMLIRNVSTYLPEYMAPTYSTISCVLC
jgi:hypothetical protein